MLAGPWEGLPKVLYVGWPTEFLVLLPSLYMNHPIPVPSHPLEERIRVLCQKAIAADTKDFNAVLTELQAALSEHTEGMRKMALEKLVPKKGKD